MTGETAVTGQEFLGFALPSHVAIIMDGNGRWAKHRLFPRVEGHRAGARAVRTVVEESVRLGIRYLTLFSFSTENWLRPREEVGALMRLFVQYLSSERDLLLKHSIRLRAIGDLDRLPSAVRSVLDNLCRETEKFERLDLILAVSYGGRDEIVHAARAIAERVASGELKSADVTKEVVQSCLYAPDVPDPDLLIRTSDEIRVSNFLLWQIAYAEIVVSPVLWPDFDKREFLRCLEEYGKRTRRFGLTDEQISPREVASKVGMAENNGDGAG